MGGAVPYRDLVTILRLASMQYITKLATTQSQKPLHAPPPPPKYKVMYTVDTTRQLAVNENFSWTQNSVDRPLARDSYMFALKPIKFTYMEMKIFERSFLHMKTYKILGSPLTPPLVMCSA